LRRYSQRIFVEIDNMTRSPQLFGSLAFEKLPERQPILPQQSFAAGIVPILLLLTMTAITRPSVAVSQVAPVLAQSAPTTAPTPSTAERALPWLWLLLIPLVAGWRWSVVSRRSRETQMQGITVDPVDPVTPFDSDDLNEHRQTPRERLAAEQGRQRVDREEVAPPAELDGKSQQSNTGSIVDPWSALSSPRDATRTRPYANGDRSEPTTIELVQELQLLEERLVVDIQRRKVGEIVVRKEIETRIVEVPIRREKLIVEQVSPEFKQLAVIDLGQSSATETVSTETAYLPTVDAKFTSIAAAVDFLKEIAEREESALQHVQMNVVLKDRTPNLND
jgi:stress response protein YsnF